MTNEIDPAKLGEPLPMPTSNPCLRRYIYEAYSKHDLHQVVRLRAVHRAYQGGKVVQARCIDCDETDLFYGNRLRHPYRPRWGPVTRAG